MHAYKWLLSRGSRQMACRAAILILGVFTQARCSQAVTLGFENFASANGLTNIAPINPYVEAGFRLTPFSDQSAVFDAAVSTDMPGNLTDWFGFAEGNPITLEQLSGEPFNLVSLLLGPSTLASSPPITVILAGTVADGGGALTSTHPGLTTATLATLNWTNLESVLITATNDAGIDILEVVPVPEPASLFLAFCCCSPFVLRRSGFVRRCRR